MRFKRLLALLVSAALALSLLAGCGGGKALSQVIVDLLDGLYSNVSVEADSDPTPALKKAPAEGGTEEEILTRLVNNLNLSGVSISFNRLDDGQQGEHGVDLVFQAGSDPDAAARNALAQWAGIFGSLPDDGSYRASVAMIETENGYYIALDVEVLKAGKPDKPDKDDDDNQDDGLIHADGMAYDPKAGSATISGENGLASLVDTLQKVADESDTTLAEAIGETNITLTSNATLPDNWPYRATYDAVFDGGNHTISGVKAADETGYNAMFARLNGTVKNVQFADVEISGGDFNGAVAGYNIDGTVENCAVLFGTISGNYSVGGLVGYNTGTITGCESAATINGLIESAGGIAGYNGGTITDSTNTGSVNSAGWSVGGIAGTNGETATVSGCTSSGSVEADQYNVGGISGSNYGMITDSSCQNDVTGAFFVGGIAGCNDWTPYGAGQITNCYVIGNVSGTHGVSGAVGGIAGSNTSIIKSSYAKGTISSPSSAGQVGGVVGAADFFNGGTSSDIDGCYFVGTVSGQQNVGGVAGKNADTTSIDGCYAIVQGGTNAYGVIGAYNTGFVVQGTVNACYWSGTAIGGTHNGIHQVTDWAAATADMNAACGGLYSDTDAGTPPKLKWEK